MLEDAMQSLCEGNKDAMDDIYILSSKIVFSIIYSYTKNYSLASDLLQDTYLTVFTKINQYHLNTNALAWICKIAKNKSLNALKIAKRTTSFDDEFWDKIPDTTNLSSVDTDLIHTVDKVLKEEERKIVYLHTLSGMKLKDIALLLKKPEGTIRWKYNDSLEKVRKYIEERSQDNE